MSLNPLAPVNDHQAMLTRIFWFTTASALAAVALLRDRIPELDRLLSQIDYSVVFGDNKILPVPGGYLIPALAVGMLSRIYRLHACVSDWLGIRECFDVDVIIAELAERLEFDLSSIDRQELIERRPDIMRRAFYAFVTGPDPEIDPQLIGKALDAWSWFWIGVESTFVFVLAAMALVAGGDYAVGLLTLVSVLALAARGLPAMHRQCRRYAVAQVRAIVADRTRAAELCRIFAEITDDRTFDQRAA